TGKRLCCVHRCRITRQFASKDKPQIAMLCTSIVKARKLWHAVLARRRACEGPDASKRCDADAVTLVPRETGRWEQTNVREIHFAARSSRPDCRARNCNKRR